MNGKLQTQTDKHEQIIVSSQFSGPIPPPEALAKYDSVVPGAAERILKMAENEAAARIRNSEKELAARIRNEEKETDNEVQITKNLVRTSYLGIFFAFASILLLAILACFALIRDYPTVATGVVVAMASVAGIFILFRNRKTNKQ